MLIIMVESCIFIHALPAFPMRRNCAFILCMKIWTVYGSEQSLMLPLFVLTQCVSVTERQTERVALLTVAMYGLISSLY